MRERLVCIRTYLSHLTLTLAGKETWNTVKYLTQINTQQLLLWFKYVSCIYFTAVLLSLYLLKLLTLLRQTTVLGQNISSFFHFFSLFFRSFAFFIHCRAILLRHVLCEQKKRENDRLQHNNSLFNMCCLLSDVF